MNLKIPALVKQKLYTYTDDSAGWTDAGPWGWDGCLGHTPHSELPLGSGHLLTCQMPNFRTWEGQITSWLTILDYCFVAFLSLINLYAEHLKQFKIVLAYLCFCTVCPGPTFCISIILKADVCWFEIFADPKHDHLRACWLGCYTLTLLPHNLKVAEWNSSFSM